MSQFIQEILETARMEARRFHHKYVRNEHLLLALVRHHDTLLAIEYAEIVDKVAEMPCPTCSAEEKLELSASAQRALDYAYTRAENRPLLAEDLLMGILHFSPLSRRILQELDINVEEILR